MNARRRQLLWLVGFSILIILVIVLARPNANSPSQPGPSAPPTIPTTAFQTCGPVDTDAITLVWKDKRRTPTAIKAATFYPWGCPGKTTGCAYAGEHHENPDPLCSPGAIYDLTGNTDPVAYDERANHDLICATSANATSGEDRRNVSDKTEAAVWKKYGQTKPKGTRYETDHIVQLSLGGSNAEANLFPELDNAKFGFDEKDRVEAILARDICLKNPDGSYRLNLLQTQQRIAQDWLALYNDFVSQGRIKP